MIKIARKRARGVPFPSCDTINGNCFRIEMREARKRVEENSAKYREDVSVIKLYSWKSRGVNERIRAIIIHCRSLSWSRPPFAVCRTLSTAGGVESPWISGGTRKRERRRGRRRRRLGGGGGELAFGNSRPESRNFCSFHALSHSRV